MGHALWTVLFVLAVIAQLEARKHHLVLKNDIRRYFKVSSFGFLTGGELIIDVPEFSFLPYQKKAQFGLTLTRTMTDSLSAYAEGHQEQCMLLDDITESDDSIAVVSMLFDFEANLIKLNCSQQLTKLRIIDESPKDRTRRAAIGEKAVDNAELANEPPLPTDTKANEELKVVQPSIATSAPVPRKSTDEEKSVKKDGGHLGHGSETINSSQSVASKLSDSKLSLNKSGLEVKEPIVSVVHASTAKPAVSVKKEEPKPVQELTPVQVSTPKSVPEKVEVKPSNVAPSNEDEETKGDDEEDKSQDSQQETHEVVPLPQVYSTCVTPSIKLIKNPGTENTFSFKFKVVIVDETDEGLFSVFFHSCPNYQAYGRSTWSNLSMFITEKNIENYLSAGEMPLPELYFALSVIFFILGAIWVQVVKSKREEAFKIHYLMGGLVFLKALALLFHGINFHFIASQGSEIETWAVLYYITHLLKGALLFITIVLIGTGWAFVKHILSDKDKKIFMIVIPLQVLANIAEILTEESEEGEMKHYMWREIFILVDLLCCGAILFPVVWSIRHLQEASHIDGKAAINLKKLKLFRRFYVMIVCYIYFTRIIVYLLKVTVPFQYEWLEVFCQHAAILIFFTFTGYHFQPAIQNPYFQLGQDDDLEMEEVLFEITPNTYNENLKKKKKPVKLEVEADGDTVQLITKRESSHDFD